jgi:hypothetical protein
MKKNSQIDQQIDRALHETLGPASMPGLSHGFQDRLRAEIAQEPGARGMGSDPLRRAKWILGLAAGYLILGVVAGPWLAGRLGGPTLPIEATGVLVTAALFSSLAASSVIGVYLTRRRLTRR